jgi:hypothetical protein
VHRSAREAKLGTHGCPLSGHVVFFCVLKARVRPAVRRVVTWARGKLTERHDLIKGSVSGYHQGRGQSRQMPLERSSCFRY